jgi:hypothetical protein
MTLKPATVATLHELKRADWFAHVGQNLLNTGVITVPVSIATSWVDAAKWCGKEDWSFTLNEFTNIYTQSLAKIAPKQYHDWNDRVKLVKQSSVPLVRVKIESIPNDIVLSSNVESKLQGMIAMVLLEAEFADTVPPGNHSKLAFWLVNGHFPCGWKGEFPNGNLVIY